MEVKTAEDSAIETQEEETQPSENESTEETQSDELIVTIGEETPPQEKEEAPEWVKELRKKHKEQVKENKALKAQLDEIKGANKKVEVGEKPTLESCDYDADLFETKLEQWHARKRDADKQAEEAQRKEKQTLEEWNNSLKSYETKKTELKVKDYDEAEELVSETLSQVQQGIIINGADNPALVVYALGKNPTKATELAEIKDPVKFAFALAKLEAQLKMTTRKAPPPEKMVSSSSAPLKGDATLERLKEKADKTGDYSEYLAYKRKIKKD